MTCLQRCHYLIVSSEKCQNHGQANMSDNLFLTLCRMMFKRRDLKMVPSAGLNPSGVSKYKIINVQIEPGRTLVTLHKRQTVRGRTPDLSH